MITRKNNRKVKTRLITYLILFIPLFGFSQLNSTIDFVSGVHYSYRNITTSSEDAMVIRIMENRDDKESGKLNWQIGLNYNRRIAKKIFLKTGLRLSTIGYKGEKINIKWASEYDNMGQWTPDPNLMHELQIVHDYWFAEIPIIGRFEFTDKKLTPFFELGVSPSIYLTRKVKSIKDIGTDVRFENNTITNFNHLHFVGIISFGANYSINEKLQIFGQPILRYHLTKLGDAPIEEYLFQYGIEIGLRREY